MPAAAAVIPLTRNSVVDREDVSRAVIMRGRGPKVPTTSTSSKAIILRHPTHLLHGIGREANLTTVQKLSAQHKLALKARTYLCHTTRPTPAHIIATEEVTRSAVIPPFNLERLHRTAIGQFGEQIDKIRELRDVETFYDIINAYIESHPRHKPQNVDKLPDFLTRVIGSRCVHHRPTSAPILLSGRVRVLYNGADSRKLAYTTHISSLPLGRSSVMPSAT